MIKKSLAIVSVGIVLCVSSGIAIALEEMPVSKELAPMERPKASQVGDEWHVVRKGEQRMDKVTGVDGDIVFLKDSDGCTWSQLDWGFAPPNEWKGCNGFADGAHKVHKSEGSPWPMQRKTKFKYSFSGGDSKGESWRANRNCKVKEQVRVKVPAGEYDTFKLVCIDPWNTRIWWISPELQNVVAFKNKNGIQELSKP